jgi:hypothetical protein
MTHFPDAEIPTVEMYLVAIAWIYVVLMMAVAEAVSPKAPCSGAVFTLLLYGVLPLSHGAVHPGHAGTRRRRRARAAEPQARRQPRRQTAAAMRPVTPSRRNEKKRDAS